MNKLKLLVLVLILSMFSLTQSTNASYTAKDVIASKTELVKTVKGKYYYNKFSVIIEKYKDNKEVLILLRDKVKVLKEKINSSNKFSTDIVNLVNYMDFSINYFIQKQIIIIDDEANNDLDQEEENEDDSNTEQDISDKESEVEKEHLDEYTSYSDNEKSITAGEGFIVFSGKTSSKYESVEVGSIKFYIEGLNIDDLKTSLNTAFLYLEGEYISQVTYRDVDIVSSTKATITFENLNDFIVPQKEVAFKLGIKANKIGYEKIGKTIKDLNIAKVSLYDAVGLNSGNDINAFTTTVETNPFSIVPGIPVISVINDLNDSTIAKINIKGEFGENTIDNNNSTPTIELNKLILTVYNNSADTIYKLVNSNDSQDQVIGIKDGVKLEFDLSLLKNKNRIINSGSGENFEIYISNTSGSVVLKIPKDGLIYNIPGIENADDLNINMKDSINLGIRSY